MLFPKHIVNCLRVAPKILIRRVTMFNNTLYPLLADSPAPPKTSRTSRMATPAPPSKKEFRPTVYNVRVVPLLGI